MAENSKHIGRRIAEVIGWILLILVVLVGGLRLSLKTSVVHNYAKSQIESIANNTLNGQLSIRSVDGDLWNDFTIHELTITQEDTLLQLKKARVAFNPWALTRSTFDASAIQLSGLQLSISEMEDGSFDIQNLVTDTSSSESSFGVNIQRFEMDSSQASVYAPSHLPDTTLSVKELSLTAGFSYQNEISATLSSLSFQLVEGRLPEPIDFSAAGSYQDEYISLNNLVIEMGRSLVRASGTTSLRDSTVNLGAQAQPLSIQDIQPYLDSPLPDEELELSLTVAGHMDSLNIELKGEGNGFDELLVVSNLTIAETPVLNMVGFSAKNLDLGYFTDDSVDAVIGELTGSVEGTLTSNLPEAHVTWGFTLYDVRYESYMFEIMFGTGTLIDETLVSIFEVKDGEDRITIHPKIIDVFADEPIWTLRAEMKNVNPGWWLRNEELDGNVSFRAFAEGRGLSLSETPFRYSISENSSLVRSIVRLDESGRVSFETATDTILIGGQKISDIDISGIVSRDSVTAEGSIQLIDDRITFSTELADYAGEAPSYNYIIEAKDFSAAEINGFEDVQTSLNVKSEGAGTYFDLEQLSLKASLEVDSSFVNGARVNKVFLNSEVEDEILTISEGEIVSEIIEGSFSGRRNIEDRYDPSNEFTVNMQLNNLQPLSSLLGVEFFDATGNINGKVRESDTSGLLFDGSLDLQEIRYDTLVTVESIEGNASIAVGETYGYTLNLDISKPTYNGFDLQDIIFTTSGSATSDSVSGGFELEIDGQQSGSISQAGQYAINLQNENIALHWDVFDLESPAKVLSLESPFQLTYRDAAIQTDTLRLSSDQGTYLHLAIPHADSLNQEIWAEGENFNFGVIQEIIFNERFVDGVLSGNMQLQNNTENLQGSGQFTIADLSYQGTELDTIAMGFSLSDERLAANLRAIMDGNETLTGDLDIPFILDKPENLDDSFFEEPVSGSLVINPIDLVEFKELLSTFNITETEGVLSFNGELSGSAGEPDFEGIFRLGNPVLSGIRLDSAFAQINYHHLDESLTARSEITAQGQKAASIFAELPLSMDFKTFEINTPGPTDSLTFNMVTNDFNISVFNDFLNRDYMTRLRGSLNANLEISGTTEDPDTKGYLRLGNAEVTVPIAGIRLTGISSDFSFTETGMRLNSLRANSGSGSFSANGDITLDGITPSELNINANASRFRLANTDDYNLIIGLNSTLTGAPIRPKASGTLTVNNGFIYLQNFGERSVEAVELEDEEEASFSPYDSLAIDMNFVIERNFQIRNSRYLDLQVSLSGDLEAQKETNGELQLFGSLTADEGYARPLGKQFNLEEGQFTFSGPIDEPELYISTSYIPQSSQKEGDPIILYYIIEGRGMEPDFRFESDPQMEQQDIICYTVFNKPCYALESWQQVVSGGGGTSPTDLLVGVLLDEVETLATQELGIDVVQIDNSRSGSGGGTSITTGWYLNQRTFFAIVNQISGSTPETLFILEYMLNNNLDLIITQGDDSRQGIDLRWQFDY